MGVLNTTPDSFSDGGRYAAPDDARARFAQIAADGAAICDIGAESTRPGAAPVPAKEQLRRLGPVLEAMRMASQLPVSIDTSSAQVADSALQAGAVMVNDITAGRGDPQILEVTASHGAALCLMHMQGRPETMQDAPSYGNPVDEVRTFLDGRIEAAVRAGVAEERILVDPGIGFGKRLEDNLALLAGLPVLASLGRPIVVGVSRKRMLGALLGREVDDRMAGSLAGALAAVARGAAVVRVHDVRETVDAIRVWRAVEEAQ